MSEQTPRGGSHRMFKPPTEWRQHHNVNGRPKLRWKTEDAAQAHARSHDGLLNVYRCTVCGSFHVGMHRENAFAWMADEILTDLELGPRVAACLRREAVAPRGTIRAFAATLERIRKRVAA